MGMKSVTTTNILHILTDYKPFNITTMKPSDNNNHVTNEETMYSVILVLLFMFFAFLGATL
jgi:hypothetical protein